MPWAAANLAAPSGPRLSEDPINVRDLFEANDFIQTVEL